MKKLTILHTVAAVIFAVTLVLNLQSNLKNGLVFSLANAQTNTYATTLSEVEITCNSGGGGKCWTLVFEYVGDNEVVCDCEFTGSMQDNCSTAEQALCAIYTIISTYN